MSHHLKNLKSLISSEINKTFGKAQIDGFPRKVWSVLTITVGI